MRPAHIAAAAGLVLLSAASAPFAASAAGAQSRACFRTSEWHNSSSGGPRDLYFQIGVSDVWHAEMAQDCPGARYPGAVSIGDIVSGVSNEICSGVDLQLTVKPLGGGNATACIVKSIEKLTPDQIKALPRKARP